MQATGVIDLGNGVRIAPQGWAARLGRKLETSRSQRDVSLRALAKESGGRFSARELRAFERGARPAGELLSKLLADLYQVELDDVVPERVALEVDLGELVISAGGATRAIDGGVDRVHDTLSAYLDLVWALRGGRRGVVSLREADVHTLADVLALDEDVVVDGLAELMQCSKADARKLLAVLRRRAVIVPVGAALLVGVSTGIAGTMGGLLFAGNAGAGNTALVQPLEGPHGMGGDASDRGLHRLGGGDPVGAAVSDHVWTPGSSIESSATGGAGPQGHGDHGTTPGAGAAGDASGGTAAGGPASADREGDGGTGGQDGADGALDATGGDNGLTGGAHSGANGDADGGSAAAEPPTGDSPQAPAVGDPGDEPGPGSSAARVPSAGGGGSSAGDELEAAPDPDQVLTGTKKADVLTGGSGNDTITGGKGNDTLSGNAGDDVIDGGAGNDVIDGGDGNDKLSGGAGKDTVHGGAGNDVIDGGAGNDKLSGDEGDDVIDGGAGNDVIDGGDGNDLLLGGAGNDKITGGPGGATAYGGPGNDTYYTTDGAKDRFFGGTGKDKVVGNIEAWDEIDLDGPDAP